MERDKEFAVVFGKSQGKSPSLHATESASEVACGKKQKKRAKGPESGVLSALGASGDSMAFSNR